MTSLVVWVLFKQLILGFEFIQGRSNGKESACSARDPGSIPGSGRSAGEGKGYSLQYSCLDNSREKPGGLQFMGGHKESDTTEQLTTSLHVNIDLLNSHYITMLVL